ncbi:MAG: hypothetical protein ACE1Z4_08910 [Gammaproteobacteria bacterium]
MIYKALRYVGMLLLGSLMGYWVATQSVYSTNQMPATASVQTGIVEALTLVSPTSENRKREIPSTEKTRSVDTEFSGHSAVPTAEKELFEQAFYRVMALPGSDPERSAGLHRIIEKWMHQDPVAALHQIQQIGNHREKQNLTLKVFRSWAKTDAEQALQEAINLDNGNGYYISTVLMSVSGTDGQRAMELAMLNRQWLQPHTIGQILSSWAYSEPRAAIKFYQENIDNPNHNETMGIATEYARHFPENAYRWAEQTGLDDKVFANMGKVFAREQPQRAEQFLVSIRPGVARDSLISSITHQKGQLNAEEAYNWLSQFSEEPGYSSAKNNLIYQWINQDPSSVAELITSGSDRLEDSQISFFVSSWHYRNPDAVADFVLYLPRGDLRNTALTQLIYTTSRTDINMANSLINEISNESIRNEVENELSTRYGY